MNDLTPASRRDLLKSMALGGMASLLPVTATAEPEKPKRVRGIVFMVSDGMSPGVLTLAQAFSHQTRQRGTRWWELINTPLATRGLMDTASANSLVTDSAAASSAWGGGQRVNNGMINFSPSGKAITPIAQLLKKQGARTGLVTTAKVTHATPAGFASAVTQRDQEDAIAPQYLDKVDVILGGGSDFFDPKKREDQQDLFARYQNAGYQILRDRKALLGSRSPKVLGTFARGHLPFSLDEATKPESAIPTLAEMADAALSRFLAEPTPFLLQIEGARIDHAAHLNDIAALLHDQLAFDDALAKVLTLTAAHPDVLVVVTSDHGNSNPGLNGMGASYARSNDCFQRIAKMTESFESLFTRWQQNPKQDFIAMIQKTLGFTLEKSEVQSLIDILNHEEITEWNHQLAKPEGLLGQFAGNHTGIGWTGTTHTSDPTLVSAIGPQANRFSGMVVNTDVFRHSCELLLS
jgi:alkaline phosphatase